MRETIPILMLLAFAAMVFLVWAVSTFNRFVKYRNRIEAAWSDIDVALKRRYNLVPNLVNAVKGYEDHEADVMAARSDVEASPGDLPVREETEGRVSRSLNGLLAVAEAYPDLKASTNFLALQKSLVEIESDIQSARNRYNQAVGKFNTLVEAFPSSWIARRQRYQKAAYFTLELATERTLPGVDFDDGLGARQTPGA